MVLKFVDEQGAGFERQGEFVATQTGVEGSLIYAVSSLLRDCIARQGAARFELDLLPQWSAERVQQEVMRPRGSRSGCDSQVCGSGGQVRRSTRSMSGNTAAPCRAASFSQP